MARRLRDEGLATMVWNRSSGKTEEMLAEGGKGACTTAESAAAAISGTAADSLIIAVLFDTAAVLQLLGDGAVAAALGGRTFLNLTSGNPDEGRQIQKVVAEVAPTCHYLDGAYCGPPAKARAGAGQVFVSGDEAVVDRWRGQMSVLGGVVFCGKSIGTSRAIDYAVVDLAFVNLLAFLSNVEMLEREGVDMKQFFEEAGKRVATVPAMLGMYHGRLGSRDEAAYAAAPTATLSTWRNFWNGRLDYFDSIGAGGQLPRFAVELLDKAGGGPGGPFEQADASRLQEIVRYGKSVQPTESAQ
eukprot:TRINITY_DN858_c0_g1_i2.p1 TRINITY_DN858_c0_g1~~TRINITY_DN858_c0_g1_i2.p1  ORF type:complete len:336 (+),score=122.30 TRINITY_DN858_c0_g1_i2:111-1010(+)